jgi:hypothetical protein
MLNAGINVRKVPIADMGHNAAVRSGSHGVEWRTPQFEPHFVGRHIDYGEPILFRRFERFALPQDLLNANGTVGSRAPTDGDRVGCGPEVRYP